MHGMEHIKVQSVMGELTKIVKSAQSRQSHSRLGFEPDNSRMRSNIIRTQVVRAAETQL